MLMNGCLPVIIRTYFIFADERMSAYYNKELLYDLYICRGTDVCLL